MKTSQFNKFFKKLLGTNDKIGIEWLDDFSFLVQFATEEQAMRVLQKWEEETSDREDSSPSVKSRLTLSRN